MSINNFKILEKDKNIINNIQNQPCFYEKTFVNYYSINGFADTINKIDYTYLVPNLFRLCYLQSSITIPNICLRYNENGNIIYNYPVLLDKMYIKSFLYFNFPASYKDASYINSFLNNIINLENYVKKKARNTTYGSITLSQIIYNTIYNKNSMLTQLLYFLNYLRNSNNTYTNEKVLAPFYVIWDYSTACVKNLLDSTYFIGINNYNNIIGVPTAQFIDFIKKTFFNNFQDGNILNYNDILIVYKYSINIILSYANEVYEDILLQINYFLTCKEYCLKDYMNTNNLPILFTLYNIFYKNQIYTVENYIVYSKPQDAKPYRILLKKYMDDFKLYYESNNLGIVIKMVDLDNNEGFIFCYTNPATTPNDRIRKDYQYFYIDKKSPSPIELYNFWGSSGLTPNYTGKPLEDFTIEFFETGYLTIEPYLKSSGSKSYELIRTYTDGGLYPPNTTPKVSGHTYNAYNDLSKTEINSSVYLTFETELGKAVGLPLVYYKNYN